jgi:hypothetical protein
MFTGLMVTVELSLLERATATPPGRAGLVSETEIGADSPGPSLTPEATETFVLEETVTVAVASAMVGMPAEAVMVACPEASPVTAAVVLVAFAAKTATGTTLATSGLFEVRDTVSPGAGAGLERFNVTF